VGAKNILDEVRVVELSEALAGPYCAMLLGDFGADVIKIERPGVGDQSRGWGPSRPIFLQRTGTSDRLH
jgi:crotonobetainyl-CoA:carnitine CoA-transferase CaiB-like acyl-CoA transferase